MIYGTYKCLFYKENGSCGRNIVVNDVFFEGICSIDHENEFFNIQNEFVSTQYVKPGNPPKEVRFSI